VIESKPPEGTIPAHVTSRIQEAGHWTTAKKLLVIDDQARICTAIADTAAALGVRTKVVRQPLEATQAFIDFRPDAVALDMIMPEKDGIDLLDEMLLTGRPARFILMSGHGDAYLRLAHGVARFHGAEAPVTLRKPFRREDLTALLRATLAIDRDAAD
jgi:DNA-binding NtrC family response regulator